MKHLFRKVTEWQGQRKKERKNYTRFVNSLFIYICLMLPLLPDPTLPLNTIVCCLLTILCGDENSLGTFANHGRLFSPFPPLFSPVNRIYFIYYLRHNGWRRGEEMSWQQYGQSEWLVAYYVILNDTFSPHNPINKFYYGQVFLCLLHI